MSIPLEADAVNGWVVGPVGIKPREVGKVETDLDWFSQLKGSNAFTVYTDLETAEKQLEKMRAMYPAMGDQAGCDGVVERRRGEDRRQERYEPVPALQRAWDLLPLYL